MIYIVSAFVVYKNVGMWIEVCIHVTSAQAAQTIFFQILNSSGYPPHVVIPDTIAVIGKVINETAA